MQYNLTYAGLLVLLGVASVLVYDPVTTVAEVLAANEPPRELVRLAMPLTAGFTLLSAAIIGLLWGRSLSKLLAILLTCTIIVVLLGLNVSILGLVYLPASAVYLVAETFGLILGLNLTFATCFLFLERKYSLREWPVAAGAGEVNPRKLSSKIRRHENSKSDWPGLQLTRVSARTC